MQKKRRKLNLVLNEIKHSDDPTVLLCTFIILDFERSGNNVVVEKSVALEAAKTLINKPIVARYHNVEEPNTPTDNFGDHEVEIKENRYGEPEVVRNTVPIGTFITEGYIITINENGKEKEVLVADAVLWYSRFPDACDLLLEWYERGININTSCEYLYFNYTFKDGIEYHHSPIYFEGHAILASEKRGEHDVVLPAYKSSKLLSFKDIEKFNRLVAQAINQEKEKGVEKLNMFRKVFELSHDDIRAKLYKEVEKEFGDAYTIIVDAYDDYFIVNAYKYDENNKIEYDRFYKIDYSVNENDEISIDFDSRVEVVEERKWVGVSQLEEIQNSLNEKTKKVEELTNKLNEKIEEVNKLQNSLSEVKKEKEKIEKQFNEASDKIVSLNAQIEELKPYKEKVKKEEFEKALNAQKELYAEKFKALNALDKFNEEEVQELIKKTVYKNEEGEKAKIQLNSILVDLVKIEENDKKQGTGFILEYANKREDLLPKDDSFESRYGM